MINRCVECIHLRQVVCNDEYGDVVSAYACDATVDGSSLGEVIPVTIAVTNDPLCFAFEPLSGHDGNARENTNFESSKLIIT